MTVAVGQRACRSLNGAPWACSDSSINYSLPEIDWTVVGRSSVSKVDCLAPKPCVKVMIELMRTRFDANGTQVSATQVERRVHLRLSGVDQTPLRLVEEESYGSIGAVRATREFRYDSRVAAIELPEDGSPAQVHDARVVEIWPVGGGAFDWRGRTWTIPELQTQLLQDAAEGPISELRLRDSPVPISLGDLLQLGNVAKAVGARAYYEDDGKFHSISLGE
jgi:hypothetical protein